MTTRRERLLLAYVQAAKKSAAVEAHQGREDYRFWEGKMVAYADIESLLTARNRRKSEDQEHPDDNS